MRDLSADLHIHTCLSPCAELEETWRYRLNEPAAMVDERIQEIELGERLQAHVRWVDIRPIPDPDTWFETIWDDYCHDRIVR